MLSKSAFNALLKTLEEPPPHVLFVFATTEPERMPPTILSRTQHFRFRRLTEEEIAFKLRRILEAVGREAEEEALLLLARLADGALRDAESLLERFLLLEGPLTRKEVERALGLPPGRPWPRSPPPSRGGKRRRPWASPGASTGKGTPRGAWSRAFWRCSGKASTPPSASREPPSRPAPGPDRRHDRPGRGHGAPRPPLRRLKPGGGPPGGGKGPGRRGPAPAHGRSLPRGRPQAGKPPGPGTPKARGGARPAGAVAGLPRALRPTLRAFVREARPEVREGQLCLAFPEDKAFHYRKASEQKARLLPLAQAHFGVEEVVLVLEGEKKPEPKAPPGPTS